MKIGHREPMATDFVTKPDALATNDTALDFNHESLYSMRASSASILISLSHPDEDSNWASDASDATMDGHQSQVFEGQRIQLIDHNMAPVKDYIEHTELLAFAATHESDIVTPYLRWAFPPTERYDNADELERMSDRDSVLRGMEDYRATVALESYVHSFGPAHPTSR